MKPHKGNARRLELRQGLAECIPGIAEAMQGLDDALRLVEVNREFCAHEDSFAKGRTEKIQPYHSVSRRNCRIGRSSGAEGSGASNQEEERFRGEGKNAETGREMVDKWLPAFVMRRFINGCS
jgi:hypothetical protein